VVPAVGIVSVNTLCKGALLTRVCEEGSRFA
jgi:hypothetical protein